MYHIKAGPTARVMMYIDIAIPLKTMSFHDANFVVTGVNAGR